MRSSRGTRIGEVVPGTKGVVTSGTVLGGGEAVTAKLEVVVDSAMGGEEALRMPRRLESLSCPFPRLADAHVLRALPVAVSNAGKRGGGRGLSDG